MKSIFLFGDVSDNFESNSAPFIESSGGSSARIALLLTGGSNWERYVPRYRDPWMRLGAEEVIPIVPVGDSTTLDEEAVRLMKRCSGIFIGGGDTRRYHKIYANRRIGAIIRTLYESGISFGGVSAGALISPERCIIWGSKVSTPTNEYFLRARQDLAEDSATELTMGEGLGLLRDCLIEVHFSEFGAFPRLVQSMESTRSTHGIGIDEPICLEIRDRVFVKVHGRGRAYVLKRVSPLRFELNVLEPGDNYQI